MPQGKGTYGSKVGRPSKNKSMASGDPKKKKSVKANMPSVEVKAGEKAPYSKKTTINRTERKERVPQTVRGKKPNYEAKTRPDTDRAPAPDRTSAPGGGPRSEGKRGKGTGWAN